MKTSIIRILFLAVLLIGFCTPSCGQDWNGLTGFATFNDLGRCGVTGGGAGEVVHVKSRAEFTNYAMSSKPYVIIVDNDIEGGGVNDLQDELHITSNKTIIGAGTGVMFNGINLMAKNAQNIILRNIKLRKGRIDGVSFQNCQHIWIDHCDFSESYDGLLDFNEASDYITVSWTKLTKHDKTSLTNSGTAHYEDYNKNHITFAHCMFADNVQRNPRIGYGKMHIYNCYWKNISSYCIGFHSQAQVLSENNYFSSSAKNPFNNQYSDVLPYCGFLTDRGSYFANGEPSKNYSHAYTDITYTPETYYDYSFDLCSADDVLTTTVKGVGTIDGIQYEPILCPGNGAIDIPVSQQLSWGKVDGATSMKMYFGTDAANMSEATPESVTLQPATRYYWKVVATVGGKEYPSPVYTFMTASEKASNPYPADGMTDPWLRWPATGTDFCSPLPLQWRQAADAKKYQVYLATDETQLDNSFVGETSELAFNPGTLLVGNTYYWRVDVVKTDGTVVKGNVWSFSSPKSEWIAGRNEAEKLYPTAIAFLETNYSAAGRKDIAGDQGPGSVLGVWAGPEGRYAVETTVLAQTLGPNIYGFSVNDVLIDKWMSSTESDVRETRKTRNTVYLKPGDDIRFDFISGLVDGRTYQSRARLDYVVFTATESETVEVQRPSKAYHEPKSTPGYDCEYQRVSDMLFVDSLGTIGDKGLTQVRDEYCRWVELKEGKLMLYLKQTVMLKAVYRNEAGVETEVTTEHDVTQNIDVAIDRTSSAGSLYAVRIYKRMPTKTSYYTPVADNGVAYQLIWIPNAVFQDKQGVKGDKDKVQVRTEFEEWMKYYNPTDNALQAKTGVPAFIDPETDAAVERGFYPRGTDGNTYSYVVGTTKYMEHYLQGCQRIQFYYTGTGGAATNVKITIANMDTGDVETMEGNEAPGKNVKSNTVALRLDSKYKYAVKIEGSTGDMLIYAVKLWPGASTGIDGVTDTSAEADMPAYNTVGQRVSDSAKGIIIRNGKKNIRR